MTTSPYRLGDIPTDPENARVEAGADVEEQRLKIRLARSEQSIQSASLCVQKMYATRGYPASPIKRQISRFTLMVLEADQVVGTITLGLDAEDGLLADQLYKEEVDKLRQQGRRVAELTKLAIDGHTGSKKIVFAGLLHIAYIYGRHLNQCTDIVLEVVPRHVNYYIKMWGCELWGPRKLNPRVNFPVNLLRLNGDFVDAMVQRYGGMGEDADTHMLYPYCFSKKDEEGFLQRIIRGQDVQTRLSRKTRWQDQVTSSLPPPSANI